MLIFTQQNGFFIHKYCQSLLLLYLLSNTQSDLPQNINPISFFMLKENIEPAIRNLLPFFLCSFLIICVPLHWQDVPLLSISFISFYPLKSRWGTWGYSKSNWHFLSFAKLFLFLIIFPRNIAKCAPPKKACAPLCPSSHLLVSKKLMNGTQPISSMYCGVSKLEV